MSEIEYILISCRSLFVKYKVYQMLGLAACLDVE